MNILLEFGIGADCSTFGLPRFATPRYEMGVFKTGKIKTGFSENLGQYVTRSFIKSKASLTGLIVMSTQRRSSV